MAIRGVHSSVTDIRRRVFTEVARLAYEGGEKSPTKLFPVNVQATATAFFWSVQSLASACGSLLVCRCALLSSMHRFMTGWWKAPLPKNIMIRRW